MTKRYSRREALKTLGAVSASAVFPVGVKAQTTEPKIAGRELEVQITTVSTHCFRLTILPLSAKAASVPNNGSLVKKDWGKPISELRGSFARQSVQCGALNLVIAPDPLSFHITDSQGQLIQRLSIDRQTGTLSFMTGASPLLGLGEGGPQFDRRGSMDEMRSGQGGYKLQTHGGRVPIPW